MTHVLVLNLIFFIPATCGAGAFAFLVCRFLRNASPPPDQDPPGGGSKVPSPSAGPDDLARSA